MKKYNLEFCFKGSRTYIQGPDIFDAVLNILTSEFHAEDIMSIKYAAHEMLHNNADVFLTENFVKSDFIKINSIITCKIKDQKITAVVSENNNKIDCSKAYSEETVQTKSIIEDNQITFNNVLEDSLTEIIVSMNKYFLQQTVREEGKWIVTKFEYDNVTEIENIKNKELQLELTNNFNNKLTKSTVRIDGSTVGYLYFSLI